jgi:hypothetical protein
MATLNFGHCQCQGCENPTHTELDAGDECGAVAVACRESVNDAGGAMFYGLCAPCTEAWDAFATRADLDLDEV